MAEPASVLVVAHQTAANYALLDAVRRRAEQGPARFHLVVPRRPHGMHKVVDPIEAGEREAREVLAQALPRLSEAAGSVGDAEPLMAVEDAVNLGHYDEIIVSTLPLGISRWIKLDLVSKVRALGLPVTHVAARAADDVTVTTN
jgi:hypothetical protein